MTQTEVDAFNRRTHEEALKAHARRILKAASKGTLMAAETRAATNGLLQADSDALGKRAAALIGRPAPVKAKGVESTPKIATATALAAPPARFDGETIADQRTHDYEANSDTHNPRQASKLERPALNAALEPAQAQEGNQGRVLVRVTSVRKRLLDEDNLCEKYHVDCCRYAGLLRADDPAQAQIQTTQRKAAKGEQEHTLIELFEL